MLPKHFPACHCLIFRTLLADTRVTDLFAKFAFDILATFYHAEP